MCLPQTIAQSNGQKHKNDYSYSALQRVELEESLIRSKIVCTAGNGLKPLCFINLMYRYSNSLIWSATCIFWTQIATEDEQNTFFKLKKACYITRSYRHFIMPFISVCLANVIWRLLWLKGRSMRISPDGVEVYMSCEPHANILLKCAKRSKFFRSLNNKDSPHLYTASLLTWLKTTERWVPSKK